MKAPEDRDTPSAPPNFGVEQNDRDELTDAHSGNGTAGGGFDPHDVEALVAYFKSLPISEQNTRLFNLYIAIATPPPATRQDLTNHQAEDRQEFAFINTMLEWNHDCLDAIAKGLNIQLPKRPVMPHRKVDT